MIIHRGLGLGQFTDTRDGSNRNTLIRMYAKEKNKKWYDMDLQLDFIANADAPAYRTYLNRVGKSEVAKDVAMHVAAMNPSYLNASEVPSDVLEHEKQIMREELLNEGKPADKIDNILVGKVNKYYSEICLEDQIFIKAENKESVGKYVKANGGAILKMIRYEVGEGIEKKQENFAEEVMNQIKG